MRAFFRTLAYGAVFAGMCFTHPASESADELRTPPLVDLAETWGPDQYSLRIAVDTKHEVAWIDPALVKMSATRVDTGRTWPLTASYVQGSCVCLDIKMQLPQLEPGAYEMTAKLDDGFARGPTGEPIHVTGFTRPGIAAALFYVADTSKFSSANGAQAHGADIVDDPVAIDLMNRYGRRPVWFYGDVRFRTATNSRPCAAHLSAPKAIEITAIHRLKESRVELPLGTRLDRSYYGHVGSNEMIHAPYSFVTHTPLVVDFTAPVDVLEFIFLDGMAVTGDKCSNKGYLYVADRWDFERVFSLKDPHELTQSENHRLVDAMLDHVVTTDMNREMVNFAVGFPSQFGTVDELNSLRVWNYDLRTPDAIQVSFYGNVVVQVIQGLPPVH